MGRWCIYLLIYFLMQVRNMFQRTYGEVVTLCPPGEEDRRSFFSDLLLVQVARAPPRLRNTGTTYTYARCTCRQSYLHFSELCPRWQCCLHELRLSPQPLILTSLVCFWDCRDCIILRLLTHRFKIETV